METKTTCFVIIGYGKKASYANGKIRTLDLDETFSLLIKPVFDSLDISCYRAIDKNLNSSIDKIMLEEIQNADIALVDISTLNANVMWELGVRHALKPHHTIMICEKEQMSNIPFDINHFVVHQYTHSEEGIPFREVNRFTEHLKKIISGLLADESKPSDSPVFTFLKNNAKMDSEVKETDNELDAVLKNESFVSIMKKAEDAKNKKDYKNALELLSIAENSASRNMSLKDNLPLIISRKALCTYKLGEPNELEAHIKAKVILDALKPEQSQDTEILGLSGAIHKRLHEITGKAEYLEKAIRFYEKGFQLKQDYYNGINTVFMLYKKASMMKADNEDFEDTKLTADYIRNAVLKVALEMESQNGFDTTDDAVWVLFTIAEAYNYKKNTSKQQEYEQKASNLATSRKEDFAIDSYASQKAKIESFFKDLN